MQRTTVHDLGPFPKSRDFDGDIKQEEEDGDGATAATCTPPLTSGAHERDPILPADPATTSAEKGETDQPQCDGLSVAQPQVESHPAAEGENQNDKSEGGLVVKERLNDDPKEKRPSNCLTLLRSRSVDNIDLLYRGHENPPEILPQKSSKEVKLMQHMIVNSTGLISGCVYY